jgi:hypothetical protein
MRQRMLFFLSAVVALSSFSQIAAGAAADAIVEQEILKTLERLGEAQVRRDYVTLEHLMADECTYTHTSSQTQTKAEFIGDLKTGKRVWKAVKNTDVHVTVYGRTAVLTGRSDHSVVNDGMERQVQTKILEVYENRNGQWQMVAHQSTRLAP